ncbi:hypothetical protein PAXINDRAFT_14984 [Paxillus involutus ATCC 200175]|uniref:Ricin B lectin domain-containing protein n=1 Tax=Paxillus involutus ATCC 200175 TaxID=664439 RepID=A0A0C9TNY1_PAXIN|nr:hypothetical protein PAXINDRAFT_14984 [Paxillus involutus ATCC 200175]
MAAATNLAGTYYIFESGVYLTFTDTNSGTNLTTFQYNGTTEQQWVLAPGTASSASSPAYTVQNVKYQTYISYSGTNNPGFFVEQSLSPFDWFVNISNTSQTPSQYLFSPDPSFASTWNIDDGYTVNNNPVILYGCCSPFLLDSITNTSTSTSSIGPSSTTNSSTQTGTSGSSGSSSNKTALTIGLAVTMSVLLIIVIILAKAYRDKKLKPNHPVTGS